MELMLLAAAIFLKIIKVLALVKVWEWWKKRRTLARTNNSIK